MTVVSAAPSHELTSDEDQFVRSSSAYLGVAELDGNWGRNGQLPFYVGMVAAGPIVVKPNLFLEARRLRAAVYIDEMHFLSPDARQADGGEVDEYDLESFHYVVSESIGEDDSKTENVLGNARVILKSRPDGRLPVEELFGIPEVPFESIESSRFIARHADRYKQANVALALIRAMTFHALAQKAPSLYAVAEESLLRYFRNLGVPFEPLTAPQYLPEYRSVNMPLVVDPRDIIPGIRAKDRGRLIKKAPFFDKAAATNGLGRFTENL